jgi:protein-tyrosine phosphatase
VLRERTLDWDGCFNVRDLGDLPLRDGGTTRWGAVVRADALDDLTSAGWAAAVAHGVRTVVDLRNDDERSGDMRARPSEITTITSPLDVSEDREFWRVWATGPQFGTPLYYRPHLERFPDRSARVLTAIARAQPGGVVFHCSGGRDRAGQVAMLLLAVVGVSPAVVAADYMASFELLPARHAARGEPDQGPELQGYLRDRGTDAETLIVELLSSVDVERCLARGGMQREDIAALRHRLTNA